MKAIIPAAGSGTRYYPYSCFAAKEILPLGPYPAIYFSIRELVKSGIKAVTIVSSSDKIGPYRIADLERYITEKDKSEQEKFARVSIARENVSKIEIGFVHEKNHFGPANAIYEAFNWYSILESIKEDELIFVLLPDDICLYKRIPVIKQIHIAAIKKYEINGQDVVPQVTVGLQKLKTYTGKHSIVTKFSFVEDNMRIIKITGIKSIINPGNKWVYRKKGKCQYTLEKFDKNKDKIEYIPGPLETVGRYVLRNSFFIHTSDELYKSIKDKLNKLIRKHPRKFKKKDKIKLVDLIKKHPEELKKRDKTRLINLTKKYPEEFKGKGNELMITKMISGMIPKHNVFGVLIDGDRFDMGIPFEHLKAEAMFHIFYPEKNYNPLKAWLKSLE